MIWWVLDEDDDDDAVDDVNDVDGEEDYNEADDVDIHGPDENKYDDADDDDQEDAGRAQQQTVDTLWPSLQSPGGNNSTSYIT